MDWWLIEINEIELEWRNLEVERGGWSGFFIRVSIYGAFTIFTCIYWAGVMILFHYIKLILSDRF